MFLGIKKNLQNCDPNSYIKINHKGTLPQKVFYLRLH